MAQKYLATYLNDHLAGATTVVELLAHLRESQAGADLKDVLAQLHADIEADRQELEALMSRLHVGQSGPRQAAAWVAEKVTQLKLHLDDPAGATLRLLESLEVVQIGIEGKRGLWQALAAAAAVAPKLAAADYSRLTQRAEEQHRQVEAARLEAARAALGTGP